MSLLKGLLDQEYISVAFFKPMTFAVEFKKYLVEKAYLCKFHLLITIYSKIRLTKVKLTKVRLTKFRLMN